MPAPNLRLIGTDRHEDHLRAADRWLAVDGLLRHPDAPASRARVFAFLRHRHKTTMAGEAPHVDAGDIQTIASCCGGYTDYCPINSDHDDWLAGGDPPNIVPTEAIAVRTERRARRLARRLFWGRVRRDVRACGIVVCPVAFLLGLGVYAVRPADPHNIPAIFGIGFGLLWLLCVSGRKDGK